MQPRFHSGVFLGKRQVSNEIMVSVEGGEVVKARDFKEVPDNSAWCADALRNVKGLPSDPTNTLPVQSQSGEESLPRIPELRPVEHKENVTRGMPLRERHFELVGYSEGCLKCRKMQRGEKRHRRPHTRV